MPLKSRGKTKSRPRTNCFVKNLLLAASYRERPVAPLTADDGLVDPDHGVWLEQPRHAQWAGIQRLETKSADQLRRNVLRGQVVAGEKHHRARLEKRRVAHHLRTSLIERLDDTRAR